MARLGKEQQLQLGGAKRVSPVLLSVQSHPSPHGSTALSLSPTAMQHGSRRKAVDEHEVDKEPENAPARRAAKHKAQQPRQQEGQGSKGSARTQRGASKAKDGKGGKKRGAAPEEEEEEEEERLGLPEEEEEEDAPQGAKQQRKQAKAAPAASKRARQAKVPSGGESESADVDAPVAISFSAGKKMASGLLQRAEEEEAAKAKEEAERKKKRDRARQR
jgi:hypothetical protein